MTENPPPQFLDVQNYRRKRLVDAARLLPILGAIAVVFPAPYLFLEESRTATVAIYLFLVWLALISAALFLSSRLREPVQAD